MTYHFAQKSDVKRIAELHALSWQKTYKGMLDENYLEQHVYPERLAVWQKRLSQDNKDQFVMVAEQDKFLEGFICVFGSEDEEWGSLLDNLHTHPNAKGRGVGKTLMQYAAKWITEHYALRRMYLLVFEANEAACQFYENRGGIKAEIIEQQMPDGKRVASARYVWENVESLL